MRRRTLRLMRNVRFLGRRTKQIIMVFSDCVAIPAALWTALILRHGTIEAAVFAPPSLYLVSLLSSVPIFIKIGLYRAVIRFMGVRAAMTICLGVAISAA